MKSHRDYREPGQVKAGGSKTGEDGLGAAMLSS